MVEDVHAFFMRKALRLAERGRGCTSPNPMVGALVVDGEGVIVGRGFHEFAGGPHAEVHALREAGARACGATLYCTLEPCCHQGRTGPCAPLVADAGVSRVVIATPDPNPKVAGGGCALLRHRGVDVIAGVLADESRRLNAPFFSVMERRRPFVTMKVALSLDGRIAAAPGVRTPITSAAANRHVHRQRAEVDAIAVGSGTLLTDDPLLTCRVAYRRRPLFRIVFDRRLRTSPVARLLSTLDTGPVIIMTTTEGIAAHRERADALRARGALLDTAGRLEAALRRLAEAGISSVLVEGGAGFHRALWDAGLVDRVQMYVAPTTLGPEGLGWLQDSVITAPRVTAHTAMPIGHDILIEAHVHRPH